jgi:hypothetical protein
MEIAQPADACPPVASHGRARIDRTAVPRLNGLPMPRSASEILLRRLRNQKLTKSAFRKPEEVVSWLGAVQAQDYAGAK